MIVVFFSALIAVPLGMIIGHTGRGTFLAVTGVNALRALPTLGVLLLGVLLRVETPNAMPLIVGGLRTATLQIVATATVAAYASLGGLGRYPIDGIKAREFYLALVGALMVTALALILDAALAYAVWLSVPGAERLNRVARRRAMPQPFLGHEVALESSSAAGSERSSHSRFEARHERGTPSPTVEG